MAAPQERYYFGDVRLHKHGIDHVGAPARRVMQTFDGVDQIRALVLPASASNSRGVRVRCFAAPNAASPDRKGFRSDLEAMARLLEARSLRSDPLVWIEDDTLSKAVGGYAAPAVTCVAHGRTTGDVVLIRRLGLGLFSLATVTVTGADTFNVAAVAGTALHAIAAADEIHLVEEYYLGMAFAAMGEVQPGEGDFWSDGVQYGFLGSGSVWYARTASSVGS